MKLWWFWLEENNSIKKRILNLMLNCWLECYNFHSFIESTYFNEIYQFYTTFQINSFYWVISVEDFRGVREFQTEKYKDSDYWIKSLKQVLLKERKCDEMI